MAKDPAFLFYSQDFIVGIQTMDFEERGKYITILSQMHQQGRLSEKTIRFLVGNISDTLKSKFSIDENGLWFNKRLEIETEKRNKFVESRRNNGFNGGRPKNKIKPNGKPKNNHKVNLMEDENVNENVIKNEIILPFQTENFINVWSVWKDYKKREHRFTYKTEISEQAALQKLDNLSNHNEKIAIEIIKQSIENGYKGFFELKDGSKISKDMSMQNYKQQIIDEINAAN